MSEGLHPIEASELHARRERVFLVLAGLFPVASSVADRFLVEPRLPLLGLARPSLPIGSHVSFPGRRCSPNPWLGKRGPSSPGRGSSLKFIDELLVS